MRVAQLQACFLSPADQQVVQHFLRQDPVRNVYPLWRLEHGVLERTDRLEMMLGMREGHHGALRALLVAGANLVPVGDPESLRLLGILAAERCNQPRMVIGDRDAVDAVWEGYAGRREASVQLDTLHTYYEVEPGALPSEMGLPGLRLARPGDLLEVESLSAAMLLEDLGRRDQEEDRRLFRRRVRYAIHRQEVYVRELRGQGLVFKLNLGARTSEAVQLQGVFTLPAHRGQGLGRHGCAEISRRLFGDGIRVVSLFVREDNAPARRAYEAAGFQARGQYRMIILRPPGATL